MNRKLLAVFAACLLVLGMARTANAGPIVVDFSHADEYATTQTFSRIGDVTFSHDLYTLNDGFSLLNGGAYNYFGERREYITFNIPVALLSIDILDMSVAFPSLNPPGDVIFELYDSSYNLLSTVNVGVTGTYRTVAFNQNNVSSLLIDFTSRLPFYGDGRDHGWYSVDNLVYDEAASVPDSGSSLLLLGMGLAGLRAWRKRRQ